MHRGDRRWFQIYQSLQMALGLPGIWHVAGQRGRIVVYECGPHVVDNAALGQRCDVTELMKEI